MKKGNMNPFKMWGSYVGAVLFAIWAFTAPLLAGLISESSKFGYWMLLALPAWINKQLYFMFCEEVTYEGMTGTMCNNTGFFLYIAIMVILGFLVGWGIYSLIRRVR